jgi:hypothetical protein
MNCEKGRGNDRIEASESMAASGPPRKKNERQLPLHRAYRERPLAGAKATRAAARALRLGGSASAMGAYPSMASDCNVPASPSTTCAIRM